MSRFSRVSFSLVMFAISSRTVSPRLAVAEDSQLPPFDYADARDAAAPSNQHLQPIESTDYRFYRRQLDACVYSCTPSRFTVWGTDADVGNGTCFRTTTHCLLTVVADLKSLNSSGFERTHKCCN